MTDNISITIIIAVILFIATFALATVFFNSVFDRKTKQEKAKEKCASGRYCANCTYYAPTDKFKCHADRNVWTQRRERTGNFKRKG